MMVQRDRRGGLVAMAEVLQVVGILASLFRVALRSFRPLFCLLGLSFRILLRRLCGSLLSLPRVAGRLLAVLALLACHSEL